MKDNLQKLQKVLDIIVDKKRKVPSGASGKDKFFDFNIKKLEYSERELEDTLRALEKLGISRLDLLISDFRKAIAKNDFTKAKDMVLQMINLSNADEKTVPTSKIKHDASVREEKFDSNRLSAEITLPVVDFRRLPEEIRKEIEADYSETRICIDAKAYRSATILCGRMLETALFRKYFDVTGNDLMETSPGTGLGKIIAKLKEKNVEFDPGITEQIHLINQVRVYSVHSKSRLFMPTKEQAQAMLLYTVDVLKKMF